MNPKRYALALYERNGSLVLKPVAPGEIEFDFLGQEMNRYSVSKLKPRRYTHITAQQALVAGAIRQLERYFVDAPPCRRSEKVWWRQCERRSMISNNSRMSKGP